MKACPRCGADLNPIPVMNAISRYDNETRICSPCGTLEGLWDMAHRDTDRPLPDLAVNLRTI